MIITSLLDTDLYKLTMQQFILHNCPDAEAEFEFKCRNHNLKFNKEQYNRLIKETLNLEDLRLDKTELQFLRSLGFFTEDYLGYLSKYTFNMNHVKIYSEDEDFRIVIKGPWRETILFEVPFLAIVNEIYFDTLACEDDRLKKILDEGTKRLVDKISRIKKVPDFKLIEFGTRRRFSRSWQYTILKMLKEQIPQNLLGTSNVHLAHLLNLTPVGTMAHELICGGQALVHPLDGQKYILKKWLDEYKGKLGIALTDTLGVDKFLKDFDLGLAAAYSGVRHDSGDPYEWTEKILDHYKKLGLDATKKKAVYSDSLTTVKALAIHEQYKDKIQCSFGIGTHLTNDLGLEPLNIVIKLTKLNGRPVVKLSDSSGKVMCKDEVYITWMKEMLK